MRGRFAIHGRLYLSILGGKVLSFSGVRGQPLPAAVDTIVAARKIKEQTK
ncbi:MAG TPA: hypothetical protein VMW72_16985 [Sedimentisphaerales bacterium]|nr:hypothetical protein [Sedimentisphaerales bacterium]